MKDYLIADSYELTSNSVEFETEDKELKFVYDEAERLLKENIKQFNDYRVIIEGSKYNGVWLETQPLGGEMYAKRDLQAALNNILIFMKYQRRDGRYPGMIVKSDNWWDGMRCIYDWMQGCFLPYPALKMYYHIGENKDYLKELYNSLKGYDDYLWKERDSDGDGCLESWCVWDTGEDNCTKHILAGMPMCDFGPWGSSTAPKNTKKGWFPHESAEYMSYSYAMRKTLAKISEILENGESFEWERKAKQVQDKFKDYLWDDERKFSFDRDCNNDKMDIMLGSEIIKCMYGGIYTQEMADEFIKNHLLNPEEFWTPFPLPSIAVNDKYFHATREYSNCAKEVYEILGEETDIDDNSWSGPVEGLTYQRSIDAMLNYKHHAETVLIGEKLIELIKKNKIFPQQFNPFTGETCKNPPNGYGPMVFAFLDYVSLICGVNVSYNEIYFSFAKNEKFSYTQNIRNKNVSLESDGEISKAYVNGEEKFSFTSGVRVKTDVSGNILSVYGISPAEVSAKIVIKDKEYTFEINPNEEFEFNGKGFKLVNKVPFDYKA